MATKKEDTKVVPVEETPQSRIHFREFIQLHTNLDAVTSAGFKSTCGSTEWMYLDEWQECLDKYKSI